MNLKIKQLANERKITLKDLAVQAGITPNRLSRIIHGENPKLSTLQAIADALNVSVSDLIDEEKPEAEYCPTCGRRINNNLFKTLKL